MTLAVGFFGKIPSRGDFVRNGLPPDFVAALDDWWQQVLAGSRARLGEPWVDAWMEAPVWRFALAPGLCGAGAVAGLWLPSTDKAGRLFPLTIAMVAPSWGDVARSDPFLDAAETAGLRSLEHDIGPEELGQAVTMASTQQGERLEQPTVGGSIWRTQGSPFVAPTTRRMTGMPDARAFARMLRDDASG